MQLVLRGLQTTIQNSVDSYLSQESQMLNDEVGAFCLPRSTFSTDDDALTQKTESGRSPTNDLTETTCTFGCGSYT